MTLQENAQVAALQSIASGATGIDATLLAKLIQYSLATDQKTKVALLKEIDGNQSLTLFVTSTDPNVQNPEIPLGVVAALQNLRNTLLLVRRFKTDDRYIEILAKTGWLAPPDDSVRTGYSKGLVEAIALAHAYEMAPNVATGDRYYKHLERTLKEVVPVQTSSEFQKIVSDQTATRSLPRLMQVFAVTFARSQLAGSPPDQRRADAFEAMQAAHAWIESYRDERRSDLRKHYEMAYKIAAQKLASGQLASPESTRIAQDVAAGKVRMGVSGKTSSDVMESDADLKIEISALKQRIAELSSKTMASDLSFQQRADAIHSATLERFPKAPRPPKVNKPDELSGYAKTINSHITANKPIARARTLSVDSRSAARGIGIIMASESPLSGYGRSERQLLGSEPPDTSKQELDADDRIRKLKPDLGVGPKK